MSSFEQAEIYLKEVFAMPIELAVKDLNRQLKDDEVIPGLKIIVTGGQAIQSYFPNSEPLRTHDYDLKLIAPKNVRLTNDIKRRMDLLGKGSSNYIAIVLNKYADTILDNLRNTIKEKFNLILMNEDGVFKSVSNLRNRSLNIVRFRLRGEGKIRSNSIADLYVVDPDEIDHYSTFLGSNDILSEDAGDYYIPFKNINGIPYASMGYILWDTLRMIKFAEEMGLGKYSRYVAKRDAIINALNNPTSKLSCNAMKDFITSCEESVNICKIKGNKFKTVNSLLAYAIREGLIPTDAEFVQRIKDRYDLNYLCEAVKRMI